MIESSDLRLTRMPLNDGAGHMPALGFGTLIPDAAVTRTATRDALAAGFRHFDCAERYRNEREVGEALRVGQSAAGITREDLFVTTKLWNTNHRPERVEPAFEASLDRLGITYLDLYLIHTPFAFQPGDDQDPRNPDGKVLYDGGVTLLDTWRAMESLVEGGRCRAIGLSDVSLNATTRTAARALENFDISPLPKDACDEINRIAMRRRLNSVVKTGVPGFIAQGS